MLIDPKIIENTLKVLIGVKVTGIYRAANMLTLSFGPPVEGKNYKGETRTYPTYGIHVQCAWRILSSKGIVVGFRDFYNPSKKLTAEEFDSWNCDVVGNNMFDIISPKLTRLFQENEIVVERICADKYAGFSLFLSNGFKLQVIPDHSRLSEYWRFLEFTGNRNHYVFFQESD